MPQEQVDRPRPPVLRSRRLLASVLCSSDESRNVELARWLAVSHFLHLAGVEQQRELLHQVEEEVALVAELGVLGRASIVRAPDVLSEALEKNAFFAKKVKVATKALLLLFDDLRHKQQGHDLQQPLHIDDDAIVEQWVVGIVQHVA